MRHKDLQWENENVMQNRNVMVNYVNFDITGNL